MMDIEQLDFGGLEGSAPGVAHNSEPQGLIFIDNLLDPDHEGHLLAAIDSRPWMTSISRRVQHYGWRYDYKSRKVDPDSYLGPLPAFLTPLTDLLARKFNFRPDQAIVNEYAPGQGIAPHVDCEPCFGPVVAMIGLGSDVQMDFVRELDDQIWSLRFRRRGLLVLSGSARYEWAHSIAKRRTDRELNISRCRRVSVTFRSVILSS